MKRALLSIAFGLALGALACSDTEEPPDPCPPDGIGCAGADEQCDLSINCLPGYICNDPSEDLYDAARTSKTCIKVVCASDAECTSPKKCSLEKICEAPVCQRDSECPGGQACLAGTCQPTPNVSDVASCRVVSIGGALRQGGTVTLAAVALNSNGLALPRIPFDWMSSDATRVSVTDGVAKGESMSGPANLTAKVRGAATNCTGMASFNNFANIAQGDARIVLVADDDGAAIDAAEVTVFVGGNAKPAQMTGADGSTTFTAIGGALESVTAIKNGFQYVSVLSPGTNDVFIPLPRDPSVTTAGGFRGSIDMSKTKKADIQLGIAAPSIPTNLLDFDFTALFGDSIDTVIDAPDLGINMQSANLPGGVMFALGSKKFTDDSSGGNVRCQGDKPAATELGCYVARAPKGPRAAWAFAGQLKLSVVSSIAGKISNAIGSSEENPAFGDILTAVLPLLRNLKHGINAGLVITESAKVAKPGVTPAPNCADPNLLDYDDKCQGNFSQYQKIRLGADQELAVLSSVALPTLPRIGNKYAGAGVLLAAALAPGRGLIPLGLSAGLDQNVMTDPADGKVTGADKPFGENSARLPDGSLPLSAAPLHSGVEGSRLALLALALDPDSFTGAGGLALSGVLKFVDRIGDTESLSGDFLPYPAGTLDVANARFTGAGQIANTVALRVEVQKGGRTWLVYAPGSSTTIQLPNVAAGRALVTAGLEAFVQAVRSSQVTYENVFTFGSGKNLDRAIELIEGFVIQECTLVDAMKNPNPVCKIQ